MNLRWVLGIALLAIATQACKTGKQSVRSTNDTKHQSNWEKKRSYYNAKFELMLDHSSNLALYELIDDWLGVPHKDNGCEKSGTDCSCFVKMVYTTIYHADVGKHSQEMYARTQRTNKEQLTEGDLVFFKTKGDKISHVGIYLNNQKFVHVSTSKGVAVNSLLEPYYLKTYTAAGKKP
ncbi:MAG: C40 family peptidase [Bacteroidota bacterium]|jgi:cell wall-associated NlpC family hydrolase